MLVGMENRFSLSLVHPCGRTKVANWAIFHLNWAGKNLCSEQLNSSAINGAMISAICFNTVVGTGSADDDLSWSRRIALITWSVVSGRNCWKQTQGGTCLNVGAGASAVLDRILATFSAKKRLQTSMSTAEFAGIRPRPSKSSTSCHSLCGSDWLASTLCNSQCKEIG